MLMQHLRETTRPLHDRVERAVDLPARLASPLAYRALLARMLGFHEPLEERLSHFDWSAAGIDFAARRKAPWLRVDLAVLGEGGATRLAASPDLPRPSSLAAALGCLYVLEGSTLGGRMIARELERTLGVGPDTGGRFYHGYGERTGAFWSAFRAAADAYCGEDEDRIAAAAGAAVATFEAFEAWFKP